MDSDASLAEQSKGPKSFELRATIAFAAALHSASSPEHPQNHSIPSALDCIAFLPFRQGRPSCTSAPKPACASCSDRERAWIAQAFQALHSLSMLSVRFYSRRSTPLTRRSKSSAWSFASSRTLSWPKPALPLWLAASVRPKTFMPRACAMMTSFTVDMPT